jgi:hypothetical protein
MSDISLGVSGTTVTLSSLSSLVVGADKHNLLLKELGIRKRMSTSPSRIHARGRGGIPGYLH